MKRRRWVGLAAGCALLTFGGALAMQSPPFAPSDYHPDYEELSVPDDCLACHGPESDIATPHPERQACRQCHLAGEGDAESDREPSEGKITRRAFPGAPPYAPAQLHPEFEDMKAPDACLQCHSGGGAVETPHPERHVCKQCHIEIEDEAIGGADGGQSASNRPFPGAPPLAPGSIHPDFEEMKPPDDCLTCHGEDGAKPTPHPERHACSQCHIPLDDGE